jgi:hypothetical protein
MAWQANERIAILPGSFRIERASTGRHHMIVYGPTCRALAGGVRLLRLLRRSRDSQRFHFAHQFRNRT